MTTDGYKAAIEKLGLTNPVVHKVLKQHTRGLCTYEQAMQILVIELCKQNAEQQRQLKWWMANTTYPALAGRPTP